MSQKRPPREFMGSRQPEVPVRRGAVGEEQVRLSRGGPGPAAETSLRAASGLCWPLTGCCARAPASPRERSEWRAPGVHGGGLEDHVL